MLKCLNLSFIFEHINYSHAKSHVGSPISPYLSTAISEILFILKAQEH